MRNCCCTVAAVYRIGTRSQLEKKNNNNNKKQKIISWHSLLMGIDDEADDNHDLLCFGSGINY